MSAGTLMVVALLDTARSRTALAQVEIAAPRKIPEQARLGTLQLGVFPQASLDGKAVVVGPGFRLLDRNSRIVVPSSALGANNVVAYVTGPVGEITSAWIVSDSEVAAIRRRLSGGR
jgi:hypothetical protein